MTTQMAITEEQKKLLKSFYEENKDLIQLVYSALAENPNAFGIEDDEIQQVKDVAQVMKSGKTVYKYSFNGITREKPEYQRRNGNQKDKLTKANLVWDVFNTLVKEVKSNISLEEITKNFPIHGDEKSLVKTVMTESEYAGLNDKKRYYPDPINASDGVVFYLSNQWGSGNIEPLIAAMKEYGIVIDEKQ